MIMQVDRHREPEYTGAMNVRDPARVSAFSAWQKETGRLAMQGLHSFRQDFPTPPRMISPEDCKELGFEFHNELSAYNFLDSAGRSTVRVDFSPGLKHHAVTVQGPEDWAGALLWVDAEVVPVPRDADESPLCERSAHWLDERFVYARIGGLWDHPLVEPGAIDRLGSLRGVLIWDALRHERRLEAPSPEQRWEHPLVSLRDGSLRVFADGDAFKQHRADRTLAVHD